MAKKTRKQRGATDASTATTTGTSGEGGASEADAAARRARVRIAIGVLAVVVLGVAALVTYRRRKDPARVWARNIEQLHERKLATRITGCFGGNDGAAVRRVIEGVRRGSFPQPFRACSGAVLTELAASTMDFAGDLQGTPTAAESAKNRERDALDRLNGALQNLQRVTANVPRGEPIPEDQRDRIATALEDVAVDVDGERTAVNDLVNAADGAATMF